MEPMTQTQAVAWLCWFSFCGGLMVGLGIALFISIRKR